MPLDHKGIQKIKMKWFFWPQHMAEPQHAEVYVSKCVDNLTGIANGLEHDTELQSCYKRDV
jgi:hypothetical protein